MNLPYSFRINKRHLLDDSGLMDIGSNFTSMNRLLVARYGEGVWVDLREVNEDIVEVSYFLDDPYYVAPNEKDS